NALCNRAADRTMHLPIAFAQLLHRAHRWKNYFMLGTLARAFAIDGLRAGNKYFTLSQPTRAFSIDGLRAGNNDFLNRQIFFPNYLEDLRRAERIDLHIF